MNIMIVLGLMLVGSDFPISAAAESQRYPAVCFQPDQYYVFWCDRRFYGLDSTGCLYCARVTTDGAIVDPDGRQLYRDDVGYELDAAFDGVNFLVIFRNHC